VYVGSMARRCCGAVCGDATGFGVTGFACEGSGGKREVGRVASRGPFQ